MKTRILCYILIPLILGILTTTGVAVSIITILSPYWARIGG